mmetsp:Transcript_45791/g.103170  ORF Transcript_45791/g.103170 Transcript_45791/m.103170 type:complete len:93 (+) Transcript_45791:82-360(+)
MSSVLLATYSGFVQLSEVIEVCVDHHGQVHWVGQAIVLPLEQSDERDFVPHAKAPAVAPLAAGALRAAGVALAADGDGARVERAEKGSAAGK